MRTREEKHNRLEVMTQKRRIQELIQNEQELLIRELLDETLQGRQTSIAIPHLDFELALNEDGPSGFHYRGKMIVDIDCAEFQLVKWMASPLVSLIVDLNSFIRVDSDIIATTRLYLEFVHPSRLPELASILAPLGMLDFHTKLRSILAEKLSGLTRSLQDFVTEHYL